MYFSYKPLLILLAKHGLSKYDFKDELHMSSSTLAKISKNENVSMDVLARICSYFNCRIEDVIEFVPSEKEN